MDSFCLKNRLASNKTFRAVWITFWREIFMATWKIYAIIYAIKIHTIKIYVLYFHLVFEDETKFRKWCNLIKLMVIVVDNRATQDTFFESQGNKILPFPCTLFWGYFYSFKTVKKSIKGNIIIRYYLNQ